MYREKKIIIKESTLECVLQNIFNNEDGIVFVYDIYSGPVLCLMHGYRTLTKS